MNVSFRAIADVRPVADAAAMRCFYVLVHGRLDWRAEPPSADDPGGERPQGFYCHRYVLAPDEDRATRAAFRRVRDNLDKQTGWIVHGLATLDLKAEEVAAAPLRRLLEPDNRGHSFYLDD